MARTVLSGESIQAIARRFRVLGEPQRLRILSALELGEKSVNEIAAALRATQSNISRHLSALSQAGLVNRRSAGTSAYYSITDPVVFRLCELVCPPGKPRLRKAAPRYLRA
jgi:DNA-binding transcriptional ArsR family regulator